MKIQKLDPQDVYSKIDVISISAMAGKIDELVDTVNNQQIQLNNHECRLLDLQNQISEHDQEIDDCAAIISKMKNVEPAENVQPDYVTTTYVTNGHTKEYYGQNGASIVTNRPLPAGYVIAINEPIKPDDDIIYKGE